MEGWTGCLHKGNEVLPSCCWCQQCHSSNCHDKFNEMDQQVQGIIQLCIDTSYKSHLKTMAKLTIAELKMVFGTPGHIGALVEL